MSSLTFAPAVEQTLLSTTNDQRIPVHRIYCVGRNYWDHAVEMGGAPEREPPFLFNKPADAAVDTTRFSAVPYPSLTSKLHFESEVVIVIGKGGSEIPVEEATAHIFGYGVGVDLTRRDLQDEAKQLRRPWCFGKGFDFSAPIGPITQASEAGDIPSKNMVFTMNGEVKQQTQLNKMIWSCSEVVAFLSRAVLLMPGDVIMTGTPAGVGPLSAGDHCKAEVDGLGVCEFRVVAPLKSDPEGSFPSGNSPEAILNSISVSIGSE